MKLMPSFAILAAAAVLFSAIPGIGAVSDAEMKRLDLINISSSKKKTSSISSHLTNFRHESVLNIIHVLSENRGRRRRLRPDDVNGVSAKSAKTTSKSAKASSSSCQAKLDTCQAAAAVPKWLFVQMADMCTLYRNVDGEYHIESSKFHKNTEWFTDRPFQFEATQPTSEWFKNFTELFDDKKGMPNAALTICMMKFQGMWLFLSLQRDTSGTQKERAAEKGKHTGTYLNNPLLRKVSCHLKL